MNKTNLNRLSALVLGCFVVGCSGSGGSGSSGGSNSNNGDVSSLQIIGPKTIYSKTTESSPGYIVIKNPTDAAVSNLHYSLNSLIGGAAGSEIDPASAAECISIPANSQCNVKVMIPAGAVAGSFGFSSNNDSNSSNILARLGKAIKPAN